MTRVEHVNEMSAEENGSPSKAAKAKVCSLSVAPAIFHDQSTLRFTAAGEREKASGVE